MQLKPARLKKYGAIPGSVAGPIAYPISLLRDNSLQLHRSEEP